MNILHVLKLPEYPAAFYQGLYIEHDQIKTYLETGKAEATAQLSLITEPILAKGLQVEAVLRVGNPSEEIVNVAKELAVDLIVIGSHGYGGLGRFCSGARLKELFNMRTVRSWS